MVEGQSRGRPTPLPDARIDVTFDKAPLGFTAMANNRIADSDNDRDVLSEEWAETAINASHNLGFEHELSALSSEHWQMVLTSVAARMQMRGIMPPFGWKQALARQVRRRAD